MEKYFENLRGTEYEAEDLERCLLAYQRKLISETEFQRICSLYGIHALRKRKNFMIRFRVPGGQLRSEQAAEAAEAAKLFTPGKPLHITARQDIQFYDLSLKQLPDLIRHLNQQGLSCWRASGKILRNPVCSPYSGLLEEEIFDTMPCAKALDDFFSKQSEFKWLPAKVKLSVCGTAKDDIGAAANDIALWAVITDSSGKQRRGYKMGLGGSLGPRATPASLLFDFIPEEELLIWVSAVLRLYCLEAPTLPPGKRRIINWVAQKGINGIRQRLADLIKNAPRVLLYSGEVTPFKKAPLERDKILKVSNLIPHIWLDFNVTAQRQRGWNIVKIQCPEGNLSHRQLNGLAEIAKNWGRGELRLTPEQDAILPWIPSQKLPQVYQRLKRLGLSDTSSANLSCCPGPAACNIGWVQSTTLAKNINMNFAKPDFFDKLSTPIDIGVSGCPNSCGSQSLRTIGFSGSVKRFKGKLIPCYLISVGGCAIKHSFIAGRKLAVVPSRRASRTLKALIRYYFLHRQTEESAEDYFLRIQPEELKKVLAPFEKIFPSEKNLAKDMGSSDDFSIST